MRLSEELQIVRDRAPTPDGEGVVGVGFAVVPAEKSAHGYVISRMIINGKGYTHEESGDPFNLYFDDLYKVLCVLKGITPSVDITRRGMRVRTFGIRHVMGDESGYEITIGTTSHEEVWYEKLRFLVEEHEAVGLTSAFEHAIGLVCFGFGGRIYGE